MGAVVSTLTVLLTWAQTRRKIQEVHHVVNSRLDGAIAEVEALKTEVRRLNTSGAPPTVVAEPTASVSISSDGIVTVNKTAVSPPNAVPDEVMQHDVAQKF